MSCLNFEINIKALLMVKILKLIVPFGLLCLFRNCILLYSLLMSETCVLIRLNKQPYSGSDIWLHAEKWPQHLFLLVCQHQYTKGCDTAILLSLCSDSILSFFAERCLMLFLFYITFSLLYQQELKQVNMR